MRPESRNRIKGVLNRHGYEGAGPYLRIGLDCSVSIVNFAFAGFVP